MTKKIGLLYAKFRKDFDVEDKIRNQERILRDLLYLVDITGWYDYVFFYRFRNLQQFLSRIIEIREIGSKHDFEFLQTSTACGISRERDNIIKGNQFVITYVKLDLEESEDLRSSVKMISEIISEDDSITLHECIETYGWYDLILLMEFSEEERLLGTLKKFRRHRGGISGRKEIMGTYSATGILKYPYGHSRM